MQTFLLHDRKCFFLYCRNHIGEFEPGARISFSFESFFFERTHNHSSAVFLHQHSLIQWFAFVYTYCFYSLILVSQSIERAPNHFIIDFVCLRIFFSISERNQSVVAVAGIEFHAKFLISWRHLGYFDLMA